jgi:hypothetical protein
MAGELLLANLWRASMNRANSPLRFRVGAAVGIAAWAVAAMS